MENSNILYFPVKKTVRNNFDLMDSLLRYVYSEGKNTLAVVDTTEAQEHNALQHTYFCRAALKRRLKQIALYEHELKN